MNHLTNMDLTAAKAFTPGDERILVLPDPKQEKTAGGIIIPETAKERPQVGTIICVGKKVKGYKSGDRILFGKHAGIQLDFKVGQNNATKVERYNEFFLMNQYEIFGKLAVTETEKESEIIAG